MAGSVGQPNRIEDFATVEAVCNGVPVYAFGYTYVYGVSPDLIPGLAWQAGAGPATKIRPKKSWEISANLLGSTPAREPRSLAIDDQPLLCVHLIDGDPETCWCSRGQIEADIEPVWIRIDLPVEADVRAIRLLPSRRGMRGFASLSGEGTINQAAGQGLPRRLRIRLSQDGHHWQTVHETDCLEVAPGMDPVEIGFDARRAKQVWIIGEDFPEVLSFGHCFSIAGVEVISTTGENLALHSRGAGVTVSSTHLGYGMDRFTQDMLWPIQYDLGFKWARVGYDMSALQWAYVEREKGVLAVDPRTDGAITEAVNHGLEVVLVLDKGNWLHAPRPRVPQRNRELMETYFNAPPWPDPEVSRPYFEAWLGYVRYMVRHFRDRVRYFEIWNEWPEAWERVEEYCRLAGPTARLIHEEHPEARVVLNSTCGITSDDMDFIEGCIRTLGGLIDVVGFHPYYNADPRKIREYPQQVATLRQRLAKHGFHGQLLASEWSWFASYPVAARDRRHFTEMQKAKIAARFMTTNVALGIPSFWNETFQTHMTSRDVSLLRNTFSADPISPTQPQPIYYALRTLATVLEGARPADIEVSILPEHPDLEWHALDRADGDILVALWLAGEVVDDASREHVVDVRLPGLPLRSAWAVDTLNGTQFELQVGPRGESIPAIRVRDWPLILILAAKS